MKIKSLIYLLGLASTLLLNAQVNDIRTLEREYGEAKGDLKIDKLKNLLSLYSNISYDKADSLYNMFLKNYADNLNQFQKAKLTRIESRLKYSRREYTLSKDLALSARKIFNKDSSEFASELFEIYELLGKIKTSTGEYDSADYYLNLALLIANGLDNNEYRRDVSNDLGINFWYKSDYRAANDAYYKSLGYSELIGDSIAIAYTSRNIGIVYERLGDYSKALANYQVALEIYEYKNLPIRLGNIYNSMGVLYKLVLDYESALENHHRAFEIRQQLNDTVGMSFSLQNIGSTNLDKGDYGSALEALSKAYEFQKNMEGNVSLQVTLANIGLAYERLFKPLEAKKYYLLGLNEAERLNDKREVIRAYHRMAHLFLSEARYEEALKYGLKALNLAEELDVKEALSVANHNLSRIYRSLKKFDLALEHFEEHTEIQNQLINETSMEGLNNLRAKYEYDIQRQELAKYKEEIETLGNQNDKLETSQVILIVAFLAILFVIMLQIISNRNKMKRVRLERDLSQGRADNTELGKKHLTHEIEIKALKLKAYTEQLIQKNEMIAEFEDKVKAYEKELIQANETKLSAFAVRVEGRSGSSLSWDEFRLRFDEVHHGYTQRLVSKHPDLTSNEIDVSILLKVNLSYKDISSVLGVSYEGVKKSIQRLYKKLSFENVDLLRAYLIKI